MRRRPLTLTLSPRTGERATGRIRARGSDSSGLVLVAGRRPRVRPRLPPAHPRGPPPAPLRVGSKTFTESVILGEIAAAITQGRGMPVVHRRALGGTQIVFGALTTGEIDVYAEYTGTLTQEILRGVSEDALPSALAKRGIVMGPRLGFDDSYALGMKAERAATLGITRISDLAAHPELRFAFSNEFMDRADGWRGLRARLSAAASKRARRRPRDRLSRPRRRRRRRGRSVLDRSRDRRARPAPCSRTIATIFRPTRRSGSTARSSRAARPTRWRASTRWRGESRRRR